jgi:cysteine desulfurase
VTSRIDLDHAATTPLAPEARAAMLAALDAELGNASSVHARGEAAREVVESARARVAALVGGAAEEIVFTATGSEANNLALKGLAWGAPADRRRIVVSAIEHPSVLEAARHLESRGFALTVTPVDADGRIDEDAYARALGPDVALVSIQWVNNEVGTIQPIARLAERAHGCGARFHCDAIQAAGKLPIDAGAAGVDLLSVAAHKLHGPLGAAALWVRRRVRLMPLVHGGHQERSRRAGTENVPAIAGFGAAAERAARALAADETARAGALGDRLLAGLRDADPGVRLNGAADARVRAIVNVTFPGTDGEAVLHELDRAGIQVSTGSACSAARPGPSHVLTAMGRSAEDAHGSVRYSLGASNDESQIDTAVRETRAALARLRALGHPRAASPA